MDRAWIALTMATLAMALLALGSTCNRARWENPGAGIPQHPGSAPPIGYVRPRPPDEAEDQSADIDASPSDATAESGAPPIEPPRQVSDASATPERGENPYSDEPDGAVIEAGCVGCF